MAEEKPDQHVIRVHLDERASHILHEHTTKAFRKLIRYMMADVMRHMEGKSANHSADAFSVLEELAVFGYGLAEARNNGVNLEEYEFKELVIGRKEK